MNEASGVVVDGGDCKVVEYSQTAAALAELRRRAAEISGLDPQTKAGLRDIKAFRTEVRGYRTALEAKRKEIKGPALERCRLIDSEASLITAALRQIEDPVALVITQEERRLEEIKAAEERAERERVETIHRRIAGFRDLVVRAASASTPDAVQALVNEINAVSVDDGSFCEFSDIALETITMVTMDLQARLAAVVEQQRREAELAAEQARQKEAQDLLARERERLAEENRRRQQELDEQAAELARQKAEIAAWRAERDRAAQVPAAAEPPPEAAQPEPVVVAAPAAADPIEPPRKAAPADAVPVLGRMVEEEWLTGNGAVLGYDLSVDAHEWSEEAPPEEQAHDAPDAEADGSISAETIIAIVSDNTGLSRAESIALLARFDWNLILVDNIEVY